MGSTRREGGVPAYVNLSASSMLMIAMQYTSNPGKPIALDTFEACAQICDQHALYLNQSLPLSSISLSIVGVSNEAQTGSVEGISPLNTIVQIYCLVLEKCGTFTLA